AATTSAKAGGLSLRVGAAKSAGSSAARDGSAAPKRLRVDVLDRASTAKAGVNGVLLRLARADGSSAHGSAALSVDYKSFAGAFGADWSSRLRLVSLPDCALTTPGARACAPTPLNSKNDLKKKAVSATVPVTAATTLVALAAAPSGPSGSFAATSL